VAGCAGNRRSFFASNYELHAGFESSSHCVAVLDGKEAYRKGEDGKTILAKFSLKKGQRYPQFKDQGYEVAGFVWWQGHKDGGSPADIGMYEKNLANLIKAWRKEFNAPNAPWAIATVGFHGKDMPENYVKIANAQLAVADPQRHPEFAGTVKTIDARPFWRDASISPRNQDYHYNHNAETYMLCGDALGRAMVELKGGKVVYPEGGLIKPVDAPPTMKEAGADELKGMIPAIKPIIMDRLLPEFAQESANIPFYLRQGYPLENILGGKRPAKVTPAIVTQMDQMIEQYELCGIDEFSWKPFGAEMKTAGWQYLTFDPVEKKTAPRATVTARSPCLPVRRISLPWTSMPPRPDGKPARHPSARKPASRRLSALLARFPIAAAASRPQPSGRRKSS
jgi:hypothetical protein